MKHLPAFMAALAVLSGTISDNTTGQPLTDVTVTTQHGAHKFSARTDSDGQFTLRDIPDGSYTLHLSSHDVPEQSTQVQVKGNATHVHLHACSTTLDYSCGGGMPGGGT